MFNSGRKRNLEKKADEKIDNDFITRNMPDFSRFSGQTFLGKNSNASSGAKINTPGKNNYQKVGIIIIGAGIIFVCILLYFGYSYLIKPNLVTQENTLNYSKEGDAVPEPEDEVEIKKIEGDKNIVVEELVVSTTTVENPEVTEELIMPEELPIVSTVVSLSKIDSDADGLTDDEESIIGTDLNRADTDNDGYLDLAEVKSGYDPLVPGAKLSGSSVIYQHQIDSLATVIYPTSWELVENENNNMVMFADEDRAFIQVLYQDNPQKLTPNSWFADQFAGSKPGESISGNSWQGFFSQDGLSAYIFNKDFSRVYNFSCSPLTEDISSVVLFNLMLKTLVIR